MLENETGKPKQQDSKRAKAIMDFLELILLGKDNILKEFSDKQMIQNLTHRQSHNTVKEVRNMLEAENIIKQTRVAANNEKFYKIIDEKKGNFLYNQTITSFVNNRKHKPKIRFTPTKINKSPSSNLNNSFLLKLQIGGKTEKEWNYPKIDYQNKICPICNGKLINFKHGTISQVTHDLDRKCNKCKSKFYYNRSSTKYSKDDSITINSDVDVRKYFLKDLVEKSRMDLIMKETRKILERANPKWKDYL